MSSWVYLSDAQCADPRTPPEDISAFINGNWPMLHPERMALLAANPSTPVVDLATLAVDHADIVLKNPGFRLQLANDPAILDLANSWTLAALARSPEISAAMLRRIAASRRVAVPVRVAAAANPVCPVDMMHGYVRHARAVREALVSNPSLPPQIARDLLAFEEEQIRRREQRRAAARVDAGEPEQARPVSGARARLSSRSRAGCRAGRYHALLSVTYST